ncbi:MAG: glycoside hydrolase family 43 C-terminal domain-containing protein [Flavobacteriales bacterium]|nr:glycoside hydrolase family 43 C-terminal domain-containing protein [Flavobacteriales bacterium]
MNKKNTTLLLAATIVTTLNFHSCKKYDDGPAFSLRSKTSRLTGEWEVVRIGSAVYPQNGYSLEFEFDKNGDFTYGTSYSYNGQNYSYAYGGEWEFSSDKEDIEITINNSVLTFEINRLTNKELWMEDASDNTDTEWKLEKK